MGDASHTDRVASWITERLYDMQLQRESVPLPQVVEDCRVLIEGIATLLDTGPSVPDAAFASKVGDMGIALMAAASRIAIIGTVAEDAILRGDTPGPKPEGSDT